MPGELVRSERELLSIFSWFDTLRVCPRLSGHRQDQISTILIGSNFLFSKRDADPL